nr:glycoside hydrolase family 3 C-terminal domain-containing protein [uncultured Cohaesibacter sp.]
MDKAQDILHKMTSDEQASLLAGADFWTTHAVPRLDVPKIKVSDGPNGARGAGALGGEVTSNCFPCGIALGASWNQKALYQVGAALAEEAKAKKASVLLAPTVNLHRSGLNGRNFECFSEDPTVTAKLAVSYISGLQDQGVGATIKHFVGNESEYERQTMSSDIDERSLRELYMVPFEAAVKEAGVWAIMSSYNRLNGTYTSEHEWLLSTVLRGEWRYDGIVMSDWYGSHSTVQSVEAGLDLEMPGPGRFRGDRLARALHDGEVSATSVKESAGRMLKLIERVETFDQDTLSEEGSVDTPELRAFLRDMAAEGAVLLKNDDILPLQKSGLKSVAAIGPNAAVARIMGGGSAQINTAYKISPLEGLQKALGANIVQFAPGCSNNRLVQAIDGTIKVDFFAGREFAGEPVHSSTSAISEFLWFDPPVAHLGMTDFSVRVKTTVSVEKSGLYRLGLCNAGLANLYLDGTLVVDGVEGWQKGENFFGLGNSERTVERPLESGKSYEIVAEYRPHSAEWEGIDIRALRFGLEPVLGEAELAEAERIAASADVAIVFAGRSGEWDTEGLDLPNFELPGSQNALIARVAKANANTIVVLQTGGPVTMPWLPEVKAVLQLWYPGQELGHAVADILLGEAEPAGRLPQTFPKGMEDLPVLMQTPAIYPGVDGHVHYDEGLSIGYRHYDRHKGAVLFPFGYGLSYTSFDWTLASEGALTIDKSGAVISVEVENTGSRRGADVVQLYMAPLKGSVDRPEKELRCFEKVKLDPGQKSMVHFSISPRDLCFYSPEDHAFRADPGTYQMQICKNAHEPIGFVSVILEETVFYSV